MTDSPTGIIPETMMNPKSRKQVVAWLITQPWPGHIKRDVLFGWARTVGIRLLEREVQQVVSSGLE